MSTPIDLPDEIVGDVADGKNSALREALKKAPPPAQQETVDILVCADTKNDRVVFEVRRDYGAASGPIITEKSYTEDEARALIFSISAAMDNLRINRKFPCCQHCNEYCRSEVVGHTLPCPRCQK